MLPHLLRISLRRDKRPVPSQEANGISPFSLDTAHAIRRGATPADHHVVVDPWQPAGEQIEASRNTGGTALRKILAGAMQIGREGAIWLAVPKRAIIAGSVSP